MKQNQKKKKEATTATRRRKNRCETRSFDKRVSDDKQPTDPTVEVSNDNENNVIIYYTKHFVSHDIRKALEKNPLKKKKRKTNQKTQPIACIQIIHFTGS